MSSGANADFGFLWDEPEAVDCADVEVEVQAESARRIGRSDSASKTLRLHKAVIAARSPYFKAQLKTWTAKSQKSKPTALRLEVPEDEAAVSDAVFYFMYHERLPADPAPEPTACVSIARLADRLGMERCVDAALAQLKQAPEEQLAQPELLNAVLGLNQLQCQIVSRPSWTEGVLPRCRAQLLQAFGTPFTVLSTPALLERFCELGFDAVLAWAGLDELCVDSENDVVAALHAWLAEHPDIKSDEELFDEQLRRALRPLHATSSFLCGAMAEEGWIELGDATLLSRLRLWSASRGKKRFISAVFNEYCYGDIAKLTWYSAAARTGAAPHPDGDFTFVVKVPKSHIETTFVGDGKGEPSKKPWLPEPVYFQGCFWQWSVCWEADENDISVWILATYLRCKPLDADLRLSRVRNAFSYTIAASFSRSADKATGAARAAHKLTAKQFLADADGHGFYNALALPADLPHGERLQAVLDDFIVDGHLVITATLSNLDK